MGKVRHPDAELLSALADGELEPGNEIADIQGCSMTAVRSRIARAWAAFRKEYEPAP